jgi:serine/threonine-protein kinase HipA
MKRCLSCGKPLTPDDTLWHSRCINSFFGTNELPSISLDSEALEAWGRESTQIGITVPGVQKKLSLHLEAYRGKGKLTLNGHPPGYILKLQADEYHHLPELEDVVMRMADVASLETVPHALLRMQDGTLAYISKRIDRIQTEERIQKLPMEDFCQLSSRLTEDKYKGSYEQCGKIIRRYSSQPMLDLTNFWYLLVFCFITGNSDMHLKNFSL